MATKKTLNEAETLEQYRVALNNVENQSEIAAIMAEFGYDSEAINHGKALLTETRQKYDAIKTEDDESTEAYKTFSAIKDNLADTYSLHRKKAKVVFRNDFLTMEKLAVTGSLPNAYTKWLETVRRFYSVSGHCNEPQNTNKLIGINEE